MCWLYFFGVETEKRSLSPVPAVGALALGNHRQEERGGCRGAGVDGDAAGEGVDRSIVGVGVQVGPRPA